MADGTKPLMLIVDSLDRYRAPLLMQFYEYVQRRNFPIEVVIDERRFTRVRDIVNDRLDRIPDYIMVGFGDNMSLSCSKAFLTKNKDKIKLIYDPGDYTVFSNGGRYEEYKGLWLDYLVIRMPRPEGYKHKLVEEVKDFIKNGQKRARVLYPDKDHVHYEIQEMKFIYLPWGVIPDKYKVPNFDNFGKRKYDVSMVCTATTNRFDNKRRNAVKSLEEIWNQITGYCTTHCGPKLTPSKKPSGDTFDQEYLNILYNTKLFVVEGGCNRDFPVQKYLEAPMCGACMIGEIPTPLKNVFKHGESMIEVTDYSKMGEAVKYYLNNEHFDLGKIAENGRKAVLEHLTLANVCKEFVNTVLEDYESRKNKEVQS